MSNIIFNKKERAFFMACAYLGALFMSTVLMWWLMLSGGNPLTYKGTQIIDEYGQPAAVLHVGQAAGVKRNICSSKTVGVEFFPALIDKAGLIFPLPSGMTEAGANCAIKTYGFVVPEVPAGEYTYQSAVRYQTSLVGRNEMFISPPVKVRIE